MNGRIICVGNLVHDEVFHVESLPASGIKTGVLDYKDRYGGPAATAAVAICHLGGSASYWGRVGADPAGETAIHALRKHGVDCSGVAVFPEGRTLRAIVLVDKAGERSIVSDRRSLPDDPNVLPKTACMALEWFSSTAVGLRERRQRSTVHGHAGIPTVLDADGGSRADNERLISMADHLVFSSEGLRDFAGEGLRGLAPPALPDEAL